MYDEFGADILTLLDDEGNEHEFEIIDELEYEDELYYALYPTANNKFMPDDSGYYIFHVTDIDGEEQLEEVEDDELIKTLANIFEERFNDEFFDDEEESN